jgi:hypothetical protein
MIVQDADGRVILTGRRGPLSKLWIMDLDNPVDETLAPRHAFATHGVPVRSQRELVQFYHQAFGCPVASTFLRAIRLFITLPGLTYKQVCKHRSALINTATDKGHLDQQRQGIRSTNPDKQPRKRKQKATLVSSAPSLTPSDDDTEEDLLHTAASAADTDAVLRFPTDDERVAMDLTGKLHKTYLMVIYIKKKNYIKFMTTKSRIPCDLVDAFKECLAFLKKHHVEVRTVRMDNEISSVFTAMLEEQHLVPEFVPPGMHRRNEAERCIRTGKNHIIATIANTDPAFPMAAAKHLIAQSEITINLLRPSPTDPSKSAWEDMYGRPYDFNRHPIAPPGTRVVVHDKPHLRSTWAPHGWDGFVIGPKSDGYRMFQVYNPRTRHIRTTDTLSWHFNTLETLSNCPHQRLATALTLVDRAIKAMHPDDINDRNVTEYRDAAEEAADLSTKLTAIVRAHTRDTPVTSAEKPVHTLPPVITTEREQRVAITDDQQQQQPEQRVASIDDQQQQQQPEQRVAETEPPEQPQQRVSAPTADESDDETPDADEPRQRRATTEHQTNRSRHRKNQREAKEAARRLYDYQCTPDDWDYARALMIRRRFNSNRKGGRQRRPAPTRRLPRWRKTKRRTLLDLANELERQGNAMAHTAVDLDEAGHKLVYQRAKDGPDGAIWETAAGKEIIKLITSKTGRWIRFRDIPPGRKAAYYNPRCRTKIKMGELEHRVRGTIGGDQIDFDGDTAAYTASMPTLKILLNAVVSKPGAKFATADIKDYYLGTPLVDKYGNPAVEYMRIKLDHIPQDVQDMYNLADFVHHDHVYMEISKSIYGLPQAGRQAQDRLVKHLKADGYTQCKNTPSLFRHNTRDIAFTLVVDDFGIMYTRDEDLEHFLGTLRKQYEITEDRGTLQKYVGITIEHDRDANTITLSMPGYIEKALVRFGMSTARGVSSPAVYVPPEYGAKITYDEVVDDTPITAAQKTRIQQIVGVLLFYARAVDPTMLCAVNKLASSQAAPSPATLAQADRILQYAAKHPNAAIMLKASDMQLKCHSDASYLSEANSRSRAGGILFLGDADTTNGVFGAIDYLSCIINTVVASAAEAEYAALFLVGREAICASQTLEDLGFPQRATLIICDNQCAVGIANRSVKQKRSKSINMRYHWIRDQVDLEAITIQWEPGATNLADFFTKNHPTKHHATMRNIFVHDKPREKLPQTCVLAYVAQSFSDNSNYFNCLG